MIPILNVLKNWKLFAGLLVVAGIAFAGFHYKNTYDQKVYLESQVQSMKDTLQQQESNYRALESSMVKYQSLLEQQQKTNDALRDDLNTIGEQNETIQQCLDTRLPDDFVSRLSE